MESSRVIILGCWRKITLRTSIIERTNMNNSLNVTEKK